MATTRYVLCASPDYLQKYGTPQTPADLTKHCYITHNMRVPDNLLKFDDNQEVRDEMELQNLIDQLPFDDLMSYECRGISSY